MPLLLLPWGLPANGKLKSIETGEEASNPEELEDCCAWALIIVSIRGLRGSFEPSTEPGNEFCRPSITRFEPGCAEGSML
jgi:hypothetical protein